MILLMNVDKDNPSQAEGENIQIQGAGLTGFELKGNTHQDSYTGKNLLDTKVFENRRINCYVVNSNGTITQTATDTNLWQSSYLPNSIILNSGTYTISVNNRNGSTLQIYNLTTNSNIVERKVDSYTFTLNNDNQVINVKLYGASSYPFTFTIQLEQGSATSYEPYVGGIPSPNPDSPQQIEVVTGDNTIKVTGKNLFDISLTPTQNIISEAGITATFNSDGTITCNGTKNANYKYIRYDIILPAGTYYFSGCPSGGSKTTYSSIVQTGTELSTQVHDTGSGATFTLTETTTINYFPVRVANGSVTFNNAIFKPMIAKVPATYNDFEPYQSQTYPLNLGSIELCKIPNTNYQDIIFHAINGDSFYDTLDNATKQTLTYGKWYKHSEIGKVVLDGTEHWNKSNSYSTTDYLCAFNQNINIMNNSHMVSNNFTYGLYTDTSTTECIGAIAQNFNIKILASRLNENSVTGLTTWLSTHNTIVYYVLATPTTTEITDTELKEDLEAISNIALFEGVNNISMESSNLTSSFKVYYDTWYEFDKILRNGYNIREDRDRITQKFANGHRKQFVSDYVDCSITLNLDTIDKDTTQDYLQRLKSGAYKYYSIDGKEYRTAQFIIENKPELSVESSISNNVDVNEYQITLLKAGD